jgi:hypothetical protein
MVQEIIFCHLEKCAGVYIGKILEQTEKKTGRKYMWLGHELSVDTQNNIKNISRNKNMIIVGNIRNPYTFYVSLWAFSCTYKKAHYSLIASKYPQYLYLYKDPYNIQNFRKWLKLMLTGEFKNEDFAKYMIEHNVGLLTSRFFELYNQNDFSLLHNTEINPMVEHFIRLEHLKQDLAKINLPYESQVRNKSKHYHYSQYYGNEEMELVYKLDNYIFKKFGYEKEIKNEDGLPNSP